MPATPVNSVTSEPMVAAARPAVDSQAHPRPKSLADQFAVAAAGVEAQPHGQFLHHVEHRNQQQQQRQQAIAPLRAGLGGRDHIAGVGVGQHDQQAGSPDSNPPESGHHFLLGWATPSMLLLSLPKFHTLNADLCEFLKQPIAGSLSSGACEP